MNEYRELAKAIAAAADEKIAKKKEPRRQTTGRVTSIDPDGTVKVDAGYGNTPALNSSVSVEVGDEVAVTIEGNRATITGNYSRPSTDDSTAIEAGKTAKRAESTASEAKLAADDATTYALEAREAADSAGKSAAQASKDAQAASKAAGEAQADATTANQAAGRAVEDAASAKESAEQALADAGTAKASAEQAVADAKGARDAATQAQADAASAKASAKSAADDAASAKASAAQAVDDAKAAKTSADSAASSAASASTSAGNAATSATNAATSASNAQASAKSAADDASAAKASAKSAKDDADAAKASAASAETSAGSAATSAGNAATSASNAETSAGNAAASAKSAADDASAAKVSAGNAATSASNAQSSASSAATSASNAATSASNAAKSASDAASDASSAKASAERADKHADAALDQLSIVQDVVGVLTWASEHGTFKKTADKSIVAGKVYFVKDGDSYAPVVDPDASKLSTYYEMTVDEAMDSYIMAHLAVTDAGLWVLPSGRGGKADGALATAPGYKALLSNSGMVVYDSTGVAVSTFGESIKFNADRPQRIGGDKAYIEWYDSNNDGKADSLRIVGTNLNTQVDQQSTTITNLTESVRYGGRNLLAWTAEPPLNKKRGGFNSGESTGWGPWNSGCVLSNTGEGTKATFTSNNTGFCVPLIHDDAVVGGETYTIQFDYRGTLTSMGTIYLLRRSNGNITAKTSGIPALTANETDWQHFEWTFEFKASSDAVAMEILFPYSSSNGKWLEIRHSSLKLERGPFATPWEYAAEDVTTMSNTVNEVKQDVNGITATVGKLEKRTAVRATFIRNNWPDANWATYETINHANNWQNYNIATAGSTAATDTGFDGTTLLVGDLINIEGVSTDGKVPHSVTVRVTSVPSTAKGVIPATTVTSVSSKELASRVSSAETQITQNTDAIALRATKTEVTEAIDAIEVGGRNLLKGSGTGAGWSYSTFADGVFTRSTTATTESFILGKTVEPLELGETYTFSAWIKTNGQVNSVEMFLYDSSVKTVRSKTLAGPTTEWKLFSWTVTMPDAWNSGTNETAAWTARFDNNGSKASGTEAILYVKKPKLEKGNKATDWTPAPEDLEAYADAAVTTAKAEIKVTTDGISSEVSKKVGSSEVISKINQSAEKITISADKVNIEGAAIFTSGKLAKVVTATQTEWYGSTSATSKAGGSWATAQPSVVAGRFIWERQKVTYSDGTSEYKPSAEGVCTQGQTNLSAYSTTVQADAKYDAKGAADAANAREQLVYRSAAKGTTSMGVNQTWVTDATGNQNTWTTVRPEYSKDYPVLFVATQRQTVAQSSGTACTCTTPKIDATTTVIDGGNIITNSITANQLAANAVTAAKIAAGAITADKLDATTINASGKLTVGALTAEAQASVLNSELNEDLESLDTRIGSVSDSVSSLDGAIFGMEDEDGNHVEGALEGVNSDIESLKGDMSGKVDSDFVIDAINSSKETSGGASVRISGAKLDIMDNVDIQAMLTAISAKFGEADVRNLVASILTAGSLQVGPQSGVHIEQRPSRISFMQAGATLMDKTDAQIAAQSPGVAFDGEVAFVAVDADGTSTFYMNHSVVVNDLSFGHWRWYERSNKHMTLQYVG